jgi:4-hydroxy-2-oxoheptanedioate aldolase
VKGLENYDEIIAVPGLTMIAMGPFDLSMALGFEGDWKHPEVRRRQEDMVRRARARGLEVMASTFDSDPADLARQVASWKELGVRVFAVSGDRFMLSSGYKSIFARLHERAEATQ